MVFTLHRYIFKELFRVFISTTFALTVLLSFAMLITPIQQNGISPAQAVTLLGYFAPITLTFVLPMAALFSTALIYGRLASDNELDACRASGISITTTLYPSVCLAFIVAIATLVLSFHIVPAFAHQAEKTIRDNAKQILFRNIQRKGYFKLPDGGYRVYADKAIPSENTLEGVVIVRLEENKITRLMTARAAKIEINKDKETNLNRVRITAEEFYMLDDTSQAYLSKVPVEEVLQSALSDEIIFQTIDDIKKIRADMIHFRPIQKIAMEAHAQFAIELLAQQISKTIAKSNEDDKYYTLENEDRKIMFTAAGCSVEGQTRIKLAPPISLIEIDAIKGSLLLRWVTNSNAKIELNEDNDPSSGLTVSLKNAAWETATGRKSLAPAPNRDYRYMRLPNDVDEKMDTNHIIKEIIDIGTVNSPLTAGPTDILLSKQKSLARKMWVTGREIDAEIHSRLVLGTGCIALVFISSALGIMLRGSHMLSAFGVSAIPAGVLIVFTMSGKHLATTASSDLPDNSGVMIMWIGFAILAVFAAWIYRKLTRT